jgi:DNA-binding CsgD family transcriptional regulator
MNARTTGAGLTKPSRLYDRTLLSKAETDGAMALGIRAPRFTHRQTEILELVAQGFADKAIARRLGISHKTVETHLRRIFLYNGVNCRAAAVVIWLAQRQKSVIVRPQDPERIRA